MFPNVFSHISFDLHSFITFMGICFYGVNCNSQGNEISISVDTFVIMIPLVLVFSLYIINHPFEWMPRVLYNEAF